MTQSAARALRVIPNRMHPYTIVYLLMLQHVRHTTIGYYHLQIQVDRHRI